MPTLWGKDGTNKDGEVEMTKHEAIEILEEVKTLDDTMFAYSQAYNDALDMAIEALKAQEPRVMTLSDVCNLKESTPVWLEDIDKKDVICGLFIKDFGDTKCLGFSIPYKWYFKRITADYIDYGIRWRCWDKEPTDAQREAVKWE